MCFVLRGCRNPQQRRWRQNNKETTSEADWKTATLWDASPIKVSRPWVINYFIIRLNGIIKGLPIGGITTGAKKQDGFPLLQNITINHMRAKWICTDSVLGFFLNLFIRFIGLFITGYRVYFNLHISSEIIIKTWICIDRNMRCSTEPYRWNFCYCHF